MKCLLWNVRGIRSSFHTLLSLIRKHNVHLLVIIEPKLRSSALQSYQLQFGFSNAISVCNDQMWFFWKDTFLARESDDYGSQHHSVKFQWRITGQCFWFTGVHWKHTLLQRRILWDELRHFYSSLDIPWLIGGDFNTFRTLDEHKGRSQPSLHTLQDFNDFILRCQLHEIQFQGSSFTWTDGRGLGRVWRRLDRLFNSDSLIDLFPYMQVQHLSRATSDHSPLLLTCGLDIPRTPSRFRYLDVWATHVDCYGL